MTFQQINHHPRLTDEQIADIERRTKGRIDTMLDDGNETIDIIALLDHIIAINKPMPTDWRGPWVVDGWQVIHRESGETILTAVSIERANDVAAGLNRLAWIQGQELA